MHCRALSSPESAKAYVESFLLTETDPSPSSQVLSQNIISAMAGQPPSRPSADYLVATARLLNGRELSDALGLPQPSFKARALVRLHFAFVSSMCYVTRAIPYLDSRKVALLRRIFYRMLIVDGKTGLGGETGFEFKYVPLLDTRTKPSNVNVAETRRGGWSGDSAGRTTRVLVAIVGTTLVVLMAVRLYQRGPGEESGRFPTVPRRFLYGWGHLESERKCAAL